MNRRREKSGEVTEFRREDMMFSRNASMEMKDMPPVGGMTPQGVRRDAKSEGEKTRGPVGRRRKNAWMKFRQHRRLHRMGPNLFQGHRRHGAETLGAEITALAVAGIVLRAGSLLRCGRVRHIRVIADVGNMRGPGIAGLARHGEGRQHRRRCQCKHQP
jgi:hypothetical protein